VILIYYGYTDFGRKLNSIDCLVITFLALYYSTNNNIITDLKQVVVRFQSICCVRFLSPHCFEHLIDFAIAHNK